MTISPDLIAQLNKLATYLTAQGEYEAVDLIDTVVVRISEMEAQLKRLRKHLSEMTIDIACYEDVSVIRANAMKRSKE